MEGPKGEFVEQVKAGVWGKSLSRGKDVKVLLNHNYERKLGSISEGNIILREDTIGLYAEVRTKDSEVLQEARDNRLVGWSFGFNKIKDSWGKTDAGIDRRYLEDIELIEVSILDDTRIPAYIGTSIESRGSKKVMIEQRFLKEDIRTSIYCDENLDNELRKRRLLIELELS